MALLKGKICLLFSEYLFISFCCLAIISRRTIVGYNYCRTAERVANFSYQNLTYIPLLKDDIECLIFEGNHLLNVTQGTFFNITNPKFMHSLQLGYNQIESIAADSLENITHLKYLDLSGNSITTIDMKYLLGNVTRKNQELITLKLNEMTGGTIQDDTFSLMEGTRINEIYLRANNLQKISYPFLHIFKFLKYLYVPFNQVSEVDFVRMNHLYKAEISNNKLRSFPQFCMDPSKNISFLPKLHKLYMDYNLILYINKDSLRCLENLRELEIRGNLISVLPDDMLLFVPHIRLLNTEKNSGHNPRVEPYAFRSQSLSVLKIGSNGPGTTEFESLTETFRHTPKLIALQISYINMKEMTQDSLRTLFSPLTQLKNFKCYMCQITSDPKVILGNKTHLNKIQLDRNDIEFLSNDTFRNMPVLKNVFINMNKIGHLRELDISKEFLSSLETIDLSGNPFICDCELDWFISWLKSAKKTNVKYFPEEYVCAYPVSMAGRKLSEVHFSYRECHPFSVWEWTGIIAGPCVFLVGVFSFVLYRKRWTIKHYIYLVRKRRNYMPLDGEHFLYDAFVAYNQDDSLWVRDHLLPVLEEEHGLKLCIHERDFQPGVFINDNIVSCIQQSQKIILVLSNAFTTSGWCIFELKVALSKHIEDEMKLIVILLEKLHGRNMNESIRTLLETTTYAEWTEDLVGQTLFLNKLKDAMNL